MQNSFFFGGGGVAGIIMKPSGDIFGFTSNPHGLVPPHHMI